MSTCMIDDPDDSMLRSTWEKKEHSRMQLP